MPFIKFKYQDLTLAFHFPNPLQEKLHHRQVLLLSYVFVSMGDGAYVVFGNEKATRCRMAMCIPRGTLIVGRASSFLSAVRKNLQLQKYPVINLQHFCQLSSRLLADGASVVFHI